MKRINNKLLLKDGHYIKEIIFRIWFILMGTLLSFLPSLIAKGDNSTTLTIVFVVFFGLPIGGFMGLLHLIEIFEEILYFKKEKYCVYKDKLTGKTRRNENGKREPYLTFKEYTKRSGKGVFVSKLDNFRVGEEYYLVFTPAKKEPARIYSTKFYEIKKLKIET